MWHHVAIDQLPHCGILQVVTQETGGATLRGLLPRLALEVQKALQQHKAPSSEVLVMAVGSVTIIWLIKKWGFNNNS